MGFIKVVKNKAYFKRYQVKYRRRREGKTDYRARKRLITQDRNKYATPKYRLVVRFTNRHCICQIVYSEIVGDKVMAHANSAELSRYGLHVGLKNYAAAYCTGLLVARRLLKKIGLDEMYVGNTTVEPEEDDDDEEEFEYSPEIVSCEHNKRTYYVEELNENRHPFHAILDVGIITTTTGSRVFGALKGATDGGLDIPHSNKRFPGYEPDTDEVDADTFKERIFGTHVADYMTYLKEEDSAKFKTHFSQYTAKQKALTEPDESEEIYMLVHEAIRKDPSPAEKTPWDGDRSTFKHKAKKTNAERAADVEIKRQAIIDAEDDE